MIKAMTAAAVMLIAVTAGARAQADSAQIPAVCGNLKSKDDIIDYGEALIGLRNAMNDMGTKTDKPGAKEAMKQAAQQMSGLIDQQRQCWAAAQADKTADKTSGAAGAGGTAAAAQPYTAGQTLERMEQFQLKVINNYLDTLEKNYGSAK